MERLFLVDALRTVSVFVVLAVHLHGASLVNTRASSSWRALAENGTYGVFAFFVISGFLISRQILARPFTTRTDMLQFWTRRVARIWPLLGLTCAIGGAMLAIVDDSGIATWIFRSNGEFDAPFWASIPTFTFNWVRLGRSEESFGWGLHWDVLWSLAIEEQFYLLYPMLVVLARTLRNRVAGLLLVVALGIAAQACLAHTGHRSFLWLTTNSFVGFVGLALGCLGYHAHHWLQAHPITSSIRWAGVVAGGVLAVAVYAGPRLHGVTPVFSAIAFSLGIAIVVALGANGLGSYRATEWRGLLVLPGKLSFACYLLHPLLLFLLRDQLLGMAVWKAYLVFGAATLALAQVSWLVFEEPARKAILARLLPRFERAPRSGSR